MADVTLVAGAGDVTSDEWNKGQGGGTAFIRITNGGTGPTVAGQVQVEVSWLGATWFKYETAFVAGVVLGVSYDKVIAFPVECSNVRFVCGSNTDQDVSVTIHGQAAY